MKYPYIGKANLDDSLVLFYSDGCGMCFRSDNWSGGLRVDYNEMAFKNITREYLQNTYGEVVSPEHAEFIIELAELHGFDCGEFIAGEDVYFYAGENSIDFTSFEPIASNDGKKQITIPLPPKADKQKLSEWPQVGDEVCWSNGCYKGVVKARHWNDLWVMESCGEFSTLYIDDLSKPKTPEEELRDDIQSIIFKRHAEMVTSIHVKNSLIAMSNSATEILLDEFEIKRKPQ